MGDPRPGAGAHHRFHRRDEAARGSLHLDPAPRLHVDVRLPVGDEQDLVPPQLLVQQPAQHLRVPVDRHARVGGAPFALDVPQQAPQVAHQRLKFRPRLGKRPDHAFALQHGAHPCHPAAPAHVRDEQRDQREQHAQDREQDDHVAPRVLASAFHEAEIMDEQQRCAVNVATPQRNGRDVDRTTRQPHHRPGLTWPLGRAAVEPGRHQARLAHQVAADIADTEREQALVARHTFELRIDSPPGLRFNRIQQRFLERAADGARANVQVAHEPPQRQGIDDRDGEVRHHEHRERERQEKAQR